MSKKSALSCYAVRLHPGEDVTQQLVNFVKENGLKAAFILTCVGSITQGTIRLANACSANKNEIIHLNAKHEITSLVGTICNDGSFHLHATLGDKDGVSVAGHVIGDLKVFTTAEIVLGECDDLCFTREMDKRTGFDELVINSRDHKCWA